MSKHISRYMGMHTYYDLDNRYEVVHKLARRYLHQEMISTIFHTDICELFLMSM